jgi:hypothetical protein
MATSRPSSASLPDAGREEPPIRIRQPLAALLAAAPVAAAPLPAQGPLEARTPGSLRDLFLEVVPWDARAVTAPRLQMGWVVANDWSTPTTLARNGVAVQVRLDEQADSLTAAVRLPWGAVLGSAPGALARRLATSLEVRGTWHWGGWSDAAADAWHQLLSFNDFARPAFPRNQVHFHLQGPGAASPVDLRSATFAFGDLVVRNQLLVWEGGEPLAEGPPARAGVSLRLDVKAPTGSVSRMGGSGGWDAGLGLAGTWQVASWLVGHAMVSGSYWAGMPGGLPLQPRPFHAGVGLSLVALAGDWSFALEDRWFSAAFQPGWAFVEANPEWSVQSSAYAAVAMPQNQIAGGVRWGALTFWLTEDFCPGRLPGLRGWFYDTNAPDVAMGLTVTVD